MSTEGASLRLWRFDDACLAWPRRGSLHYSSAPNSCCDELLDRAFGARRPELPQLDVACNTAAVADVEFLGLSDAYVYSVAFVAAGGKAACLEVIDRKNAQAILNYPSNPDVARTARARRRGQERVADGGFAATAPVATNAIVDGTPVELGAARLEAASRDDDTLLLRLVDGGGKELAKERFKPVREGDCSSTPSIRGVWLDATKKRVLIEVGYVTGPHECSGPAPAHRLWVTP